ncbi:flagellar biosynthesis anti-sigma factor FlgM [Thermicanus aegyptius]|uniref:flagellar biosynthesis anti-sigma factor FlgM n=1 Tax=Thermicanus aegyptius TaxID=94009 RepID=UPI000409BDFB|nr:flagellar biosynthesis anti-sigma factor FlgM [Thermicanus aegyptius]
MKIDGINPFGQTHPYSKPTVKGNEAKPSLAPKDQLEISPESLERFSETLEGVDPARQKKIEALKKEVEAGTYTVSAQQLADRLLAWWRGK